MTRRQKLAEQQRLRELHDNNKRWIVFAVISGVTCGLGNYLMGIHLSKAGIMGAGLTGPLNLVILLTYRLV
jgi:hypothetical protein